MTTAAHAAPATYDDLLALDPDLRAEILDGEILVSPSAGPRHNRLAFRLAKDLSAAAVQHGYDVLLDVDVLWPGGQVTRPDVFVVTEEVAEQASPPVREVPVLVVEVLSPDSPGRDLVRKPRIAADAGVPEYWVLDPATGEVYRHTLTGDRYDVDVVEPGEERVVSTLPFPYTLRPAALVTKR